MSWSGPDRDDDSFVRELAAVMARAEPVPAHVLDQAKAAYAWRDISASIALLEYDSLLDDDGLARVRSAGSERTLLFRCDETVVRVAVVDGGRRLVGHISPARYDRVEVRQGDDVALASVDGSGRFLVEDVAAGSLSLRCRPADRGAPVVETEWVTV